MIILSLRLRKAMFSQRKSFSHRMQEKMFGKGHSMQGYSQNIME
jgi:hypothetical protein